MTSVPRLPSRETLYYGNGAAMYAATSASSIDVARSGQILLRATRSQPDALVLDIGCGNGQLAKVLRGRRRLVGLDLSLDMLAIQLGPMAIVNADCLHMPFRSDVFAAASMTAGSVAMFDAADRRNLLRETARVLAAGATFVASLWSFPEIEPGGKRSAEWEIKDSTGWPMIFRERVTADGMRRVEIDSHNASTLASQTHLIGVAELQDELEGVGLQVYQTGRLFDAPHPFGSIGMTLMAATRLGER